MTNKSIQKSLNECKECSKHIMNDICVILKNKDIDYDMKGKSEIHVKSDKDIEKIIRDNINLPNYIVILLLDITKLKTGTYVRLKREDS